MPNLMLSVILFLLNLACTLHVSFRYLFYGKAKEQEIHLWKFILLSESVR